jgi:hypothetical protein
MFSRRSACEDAIDIPKKDRVNSCIFGYSGSSDLPQYEQELTLLCPMLDAFSITEDALEPSINTNGHEDTRCEPNETRLC